MNIDIYKTYMQKQNKTKVYNLLKYNCNTVNTTHNTHTHGNVLLLSQYTTNIIII